MIDQVVATLPDAESGFIMLFSSNPFPGHQIALSWRRADGNGNWYFSEQLDMKGWLCPALLKYFEQPPKRNLCAGQSKEQSAYKASLS